MSSSIEVQPAAGKHAIEVMALAVEWDRPLAPETLKEMEQIYHRTAAIKQVLPNIELVKGMSFQFGNDGAAVSTQESGGFQLFHVDQSGLTTLTLSVRPDLIACNWFNYDRWNSVKPTAISVLTPFVDAALSVGCLIQAIGLQYQDCFRVKTAEPLLATKRLFRVDGPWLSPHALNTNGSWHVHQGWFSASKSSRRVHNLLNVDFVAEVEQAVVRINGQHRVQAVDKNGIEQMQLGAADISDTLEDLHNCNKIALIKLLEPSVCEQIKLNYQGLV